MALISCPECKNQVSSVAASCPKCGSPVDVAETQAAGAPLTTVQETSKKFKLQILLASIMFWAGLFMIVYRIQTGAKVGNVWYLLASIIGLVWYIITKFRVWWHHK